MITPRSGAAGSRKSAAAMAQYQSATKDVPELAATLTAYLGESYGPEVAGGTAAIPARNMHPLVAELLEIDTSRSQTLEEMTNLLAGFTTTGKDIPGKAIQPSTREKVRLAFTDFTFSAPKSFSIALALAPTDAERQTLETCWLRANAAVCDLIESHIGQARMGAGGRDGSVPGHMAVIHYNHYTARPTIMLADGDDTVVASVPQGSVLRPGDMQRHTHNIFMHVTVTDDGKVKAPNLYEAHERIHEWGAIGQAFLGTFLREQGIRAEINPRTGLLHLPDVPEMAVKLFSARTEEGVDAARRYAAENGINWDTASAKVKADLIGGRVGVMREKKTEGPADYAAWLKTAADAGYQHQSVVDPESRTELAPKEERARIAYEASLPMLEEEWTRRAKLEGSVPRIMAARGYIAAGIADPSEIEAVVDAYRTEGVRQDGELTAIISAPEHGKRFGSVTTTLHVDRETEAISLLKAAAADRTADLTAEQFDAAIQRVSLAKGLDFTTEHGRKQRDMGLVLVTSGRASVGIGVAGSGKSAVASPVIDAYHEAGWQSYGVTLAWRQTHGLKEAGVGQKKPKGPKLEPDTDRLTGAGIDKRHAFAMAPFLTAAEKGDVVLNDKTLVVIDEIGTISTQQILQIARLQAQTGFKLVGLGDDGQCQAISAGNTIALFRRALGSDQVPELLETIRQRRIADRETADLFRKGKADLALARKDAAGLLTLVPGSYHDTIRAGVDWWERRIAERADRPDYSIGISVPTNADVRAVGIEVRARQRASGKLGEDWTIAATDQNGVHADMAVAVGDKVRLFNRVNASFGKGSRGYFGENGTTADVVAIGADNISLRRADGKVGTIGWETLKDKTSGRVRLAYGSALTIDARQSETLTDHLTLMPSGTAAVTAFKMYPSDTRNREDSQIIVSHGAEKAEVRNRRPMGDPWLTSATDTEMREAIMANMARNLSRQPEKQLGVEFIDRSINVERGSINRHQASWFKQSEPARPKRRQQERATTQKTVRHERVKLLAGPDPEQVRREKRSMRQTNRATPTPPRPTPTRDRADAVAELAEALRREGFQLRSEPILDGKWHRERVEGDRGHTRSGRYRAFDDGRPAGFIQNFKHGDGIRWAASRESPMTDAERQQLAARRAARAQEQAETLRMATTRAQAQWRGGIRVQDHPYLQAKGIDTDEAFRRDAKGNLMTALVDGTGLVRNVQTISRDGQKRFATGAQVSGLFSVIGTINRERPVIIAEGVATAKTMHDATGLAVIIAYNAGNLGPVSRTIAEIAPNSRQIFAADNDFHLPMRDPPLPNVGKEKAEAAAKEVGGIVLLPGFGDTLLKGGHVPTDWNDFAASFGKDRLRATIETSLRNEGFAMPTKKPEVTATQVRTTQAERDAARQAAAATPQTTQAQAQQALRHQQQHRLNHNHSRGLSR